MLWKFLFLQNIRMKQLVHFIKNFWRPNLSSLVSSHSFMHSYAEAMISLWIVKSLIRVFFMKLQKKALKIS